MNNEIVRAVLFYEEFPGTRKGSKRDVMKTLEMNDDARQSDAVQEAPVDARDSVHPHSL